ncbi:hypothetical protein AB0H73_38570 [Streptomyces olivoreticuli]
MAELPLAQDTLPPGLPQHVYEDHNRRRKATAIAYDLLTAHMGRMLPSDVERITARDMDVAADRAGVEHPGSDAARTLVRDLLRAYATAQLTEDTARTPEHGPQSGSELTRALVSLIEAIEQAVRK